MKPAESTTKRTNSTKSGGGGRGLLLRRRWLLLAGPFLLLLIAAACDGGEGGDAAYTPQSANYPTDVSACQPLNKFDRYRFSHSFHWLSPEMANPPENADMGSPPFSLFPKAPNFEFGQTWKGSIVNPDKIDAVVTTLDVSATGETPELKMRWVEGESWTNLGDRWMSTGDQPMNFPPALFCHSILNGLDMSTATPQAEKVGDVDTEHYSFDQVALETASILWGAEGDPARLLKNWDVDVWLTKDGWPAKLETKSQAKYPSGRDFSAELTLEITDPNAKDIKIETPATQ